VSSATRRLMANLRKRMGHDKPLAAPPALFRIPDPPRRVFPKVSGGSDYAKKAAAHTTALVGIGHVGSRYATDVVLQFQAELAVAHEAVAAELPPDWAESRGLMSLQSQVQNHREFLLRPDLGRRLCQDSVERLRSEAQRDMVVQIILAVGLSAVACMGSGMDLVSELEAACGDLGMGVGSRICAKFARVWLEDEIGSETRARVAIIVLGERPGLGTGDGLSAYLVYEPRVGKTDSDRNMMSNIHQRGTPPALAAKRLAQLARAMIDQGRSGVTLDLSALPELAAAATPSQKRERLVEVEA
jgi:ethanolamine ammonia-lyase small subunit